MTYKKMKIQVMFLMALLTIGSISFSRLSFTNASPAQTVVYVDPAEVKDIMPPGTFTIKVKIANVTGLYGIDIQFTWDPTIIQYVTHSKRIPVQTYPDGILNKPTLPVRDDVDENASMPGSVPGTRYWLSEACMSPAVPFDGNGTIFEMTFQVVGLGNSQLKILYCILSDQTGKPIARTLKHGVFINYSPPPVDIFVSPSTVVNSSLLPCENFTVSVNVTWVTNFYGFDFWLGYNNTILEVEDVTINPLFPPPAVIYEVGQLEVSASLVPPDPPITGDLYLAKIKFHVIDVGESILDLHNVTLLDDLGQPISYNEPGDGYFNNMLITRIFVDPPEIIDPTMNPGDLFTIDIDIENAIGMYGYEFKLGYDTLVLTCLGAVVIPPNTDTNFIVEQFINDTQGIIWVKVQYYPPAEPIDIYSPQPVTRIHFMVQDYGQTVLDLHDAGIVDKSGNSLEPIVEDGFFATLLRDVAIIFVNVTSQNKVYPGRIVTIIVVPMNRGNLTIETFNVTLYRNSTPIEIKEVTLGPWSNTTLTFYWNTSGLTPCNNFTIWAEASAVPYEINPFNNVYYDGWVKIKLFGDVNGDGTIDILDLVEACSRYALKKGDPGWSDDCDLNEDGYINILDIVTISSRYGQSC